MYWDNVPAGNVLVECSGVIKHFPLRTTPYNIISSTIVFQITRVDVGMILWRIIEWWCETYVWSFVCWSIVYARTAAHGQGNSSIECLTKKPTPATRILFKNAVEESHGLESLTIVFALETSQLEMSWLKDEAFQNVNLCDQARRMVSYCNVPSHESTGCRDDIVKNKRMMVWDLCLIVCLLKPPNHLQSQSLRRRPTWKGRGWN